MSDWCLECDLLDEDAVEEFDDTEHMVGGCRCSAIPLGLRVALMGPPLPLTVCDEVVL